MRNNNDRTKKTPASANQGHQVAPQVVSSFLENVMPFKELGKAEIEKVAMHCCVDFFPKGTRIMTVDETEISHLYLVQRGGVKAFLIDAKGEEVLKDYRGEGAYIGALGIIRGTLGQSQHRNR
jgi:CBS domain-containing protein